MVFNTIESPDIVSSSKQPKCVTLEYCLISVSLYIILSFTAFFNFASNLNWRPTFLHSKKEKGKQRKNERASKQKLLKGCKQGQNVTVLAILERLEFKDFICRSTMVAGNTF